MHTCPVCGFPKLDDPPTSFTICPCCGTEFEFDDVHATYTQLRERWLMTGPQWFSHSDPIPKNWDPLKQLNNLKISYPL